MTLDDVAACHVLFVASYEFTTVSRVVCGLAARPILTVGTAPGFARAGGLIGFTSVNGRVRFEINPQAAARAGLKINAQLLKLAIIVGEGE